MHVVIRAINQQLLLHRFFKPRGRFDREALRGKPMRVQAQRVPAIDLRKGFISQLGLRIGRDNRRGANMAGAVPIRQPDHFGRFARATPRRRRFAKRVRVQPHRQPPFLLLHMRRDLLQIVPLPGPLAAGVPQRRVGFPPRVRKQDELLRIVGNGRLPQLRHQHLFMLG